MDRIDIWLRDGKIIASNYRDKIKLEGIASAKSYGERSEGRNWIFFDSLFEGISLPQKITCLDIGCGKAELIDYLQNNYRDRILSSYFGLDLVSEYLEIASLKYPNYQFLNCNFLEGNFTLEKQFDLVIALGVLVTRVRYYPEYIAYFIEKMTDRSQKYVLFNLIGEVARNSSNYFNSDLVGHSTVFPVEQLRSILSKFNNFSYFIKQRQIFDDAIDLFVVLQRIDI